MTPSAITPIVYGDTIIVGCRRQGRRTAFPLEGRRRVDRGKDQSERISTAEKLYRCRERNLGAACNIRESRVHQRRLIADAVDSRLRSDRS